VPNAPRGLWWKRDGTSSMNFCYFDSVVVMSSSCMVNYGMEVITADKTLLRYIDKMQKANAEDLAFYPLSALEQALGKGRILTVKENGELAGYLWFGAMWTDRPVVIYQACVDYELRRHYLGHAMVRQLIDWVKANGGVGIRCRVASSNESNQFWQAIGFHCFAVDQGGVKRKRDINSYKLDFANEGQGNLVVPSSKSVDLRSYQKDKAAGIAMPSRFSRSHY